MELLSGWSYFHVQELFQQKNATKTDILNTYNDLSYLNAEKNFC